MLLQSVPLKGIAGTLALPADIAELDSTAVMDVDLGLGRPYHVKGASSLCL